MRRFLYSVPLGLAVACSQAEVKMPPATGAGAPPLPALPKIDNGTGSVAVAEGRTTGTTYPKEVSEVGPKVTGVISRIEVKEGQRVKKGDVLFRQDDSDAKLRLSAAEVGLAAAKVQLKAMQVELDRNKVLLEQGAIQRAQWDQLEPRYEGAKIGVQQAEVQVEMARKFVEDAAVRSPLSGVVTSKAKNEGEMATTMPPTVVVIVQDQSTLELRFRMSERALVAVKPGDRVDAKFQALGIAREARVVRLSPTVDARTRTVELIAELPNADLALRPGLLAEIEVLSEAVVEKP
ncbi:MAG: efflux RND transporter periplasmic adaptor subunit [Deltaproteobacteria bacterium]|nr:efflux RND transporter periplasmic adaptor subunit [Deltaproteobacteria bacterium]